MTLRSVYGSLITLPESPPGGITVASGTNIIDAANESVQYIGYIQMDGGSAAGTKTISPAGPGKIYWNTGAVTFTNAGTTLRIGIQDVSTSTSPAQGDGTFDVYTDLVGGTDTIGATSPQTTAMANGTKDIVHGQLVSIAFTLSSRGGTDTINLRSWSTAKMAGSLQMPATMTNVTGSFVRGTGVPDAIIEFNDGTLGWLFGTFTLPSQSNVTFNLSSGTADEYGNVIVPPMKGRAVAAFGAMSPASSSADFEICLYSDPMNIGAGISLIDKIEVDATQLAHATSFGTFVIPFPTEHILNAGTTYGISYRPTTANNITAYYHDVADPRFWKAIMLGDNCYAIRRIDNSGGFSDYNGGTAKTRRIWLSLVFDQFNDNAGNASSFIGL